MKHQDQDCRNSYPGIFNGKATPDSKCNFFLLLTKSHLIVLLEPVLFAPSCFYKEYVALWNKWNRFCVDAEILTILLTSLLFHVII
jgi:hypothetical protein